MSVSRTICEFVWAATWETKSVPEVLEKAKGEMRYPGVLAKSEPFSFVLYIADTDVLGL